MHLYLVVYEADKSGIRIPACDEEPDVDSWVLVHCGTPRRAIRHATLPGHGKTTVYKIGHATNEVTKEGVIADSRHEDALTMWATLTSQGAKGIEGIG